MVEEKRQIPGRREEDRWALWDKRIRDIALFTFGSIGFFHEVLVRPEPSIIIIVASGALMGVPFALLADQLKNRGPNGSS